MSKYEPLGKHLAANNQERITMTFEDIEKALGFALRKYMRTYPAAWYGTADGSKTHVAKRVWHEHGYSVETVDLKQRVVTFIKLGEERQRKKRTPKTTSS